MDQTQEEEYKRTISDLKDVVRSKDQTISELEKRLKEMDIRSMSIPNDGREHDIGATQDINTRSGIHFLK